MVDRVDLATFDARHGPALKAALVEQSRFTFILPRVRADATDGAKLWSAGGGAACAVAHHGTLIIGDLDDAAIEAVIADAIAPDLRQIGGPGPAIEHARRLCRRTGMAFSDPLAMRTMVLRKRPGKRATAGRGRTADMRDLARIKEWVSAFEDEALPGQASPPDAQVARCRRLIGGGCVVLWEEHDTPVAMAALVQDLPDIAAVSLVYTPKRKRGRGYAGAAVSLLSTRIIDSGRPACLYVDAANPISTRCYMRIGYEAVAAHASVYRMPETARYGRVQGRSAA